MAWAFSTVGRSTGYVLVVINSERPTKLARSKELICQFLDVANQPSF